MIWHFSISSWAPLPSQSSLGEPFVNLSWAKEGLGGGVGDVIIDCRQRCSSKTPTGRYSVTQVLQGTRMQNNWGMGRYILSTLFDGVAASGQQGGQEFRPLPLWTLTVRKCFVFRHSFYFCLLQLCAFLRPPLFPRNWKMDGSVQEASDCNCFSLCLVCLLFIQI